MTAHESLARHHQPKRVSEKKFGLLFAMIFFAISIFPLFFAGGLTLWALCISIVMALFAFIAPKKLERLHTLWLALGHRIGLVMNFIVMTILFFLFITPAAMLQRLFGRDKLLIRKPADMGSYWRKRPDSENVIDMTKQF